MKRTMNIAIAMMMVLGGMLGVLAMVPGTVDAAPDCTAPQDLSATHDGTDVILSWTAPAVGTPIIYKVYEDSDNDITNGFDEDYLGSSTDRTFGGVDNELAGDYSDSNNHYYVVRAYDEDFDESPDSNLLYKHVLTNNNEDNEHNEFFWVSIPYDSEYDTLKDLTDDISADGSMINEVATWNTEMNRLNKRSFLFGTSWSDDYTTLITLEPGQAVRFNICPDTEFCWAVLGSDAEVGVELVNGGWDWNWISVPYYSDYTTLKAITDDISEDGGIVREAAVWNTEMNRFDKRSFLFGTSWSDDYTTLITLEPGQAVRLIMSQNHTWTPEI